MRYCSASFWRCGHGFKATVPTSLSPLALLVGLGGGLLAELASPGYLMRLGGSFLTAWLAGLALVMQLVAAVLIRRLGRVRT